MHPFVMGLECTVVWKSPALPLPRTLLLHCFVLFSTLGVNRLQLCAHLSPNYAKRHQESWNSRLWTQEKFMSGLTMALRRRNLRDPGCRKVNWQGAKGRGGFLAGAQNSDNNNHSVFIASAYVASHLRGLGRRGWQWQCWGCSRSQTLVLTRILALLNLTSREIRCLPFYADPDPPSVSSVRP